MPVSHSRPFSSCEPQSPFTSSARSWYAKPPTTTPSVAEAAGNAGPEVWGWNTRAKRWSWVPSISKVGRRLHLELMPIVDQWNNYIRLASHSDLMCSLYYHFFSPRHWENGKGDSDGGLTATSYCNNLRTFSSMKHWIILTFSFYFISWLKASYRHFLFLYLIAP